MYERLNVSTNDARLSSDLPPADTYPPLTLRTWIMAFLFQFSKENACPLQPDTHKSLIYIDSAWRTLARPQEKPRYISASRACFWTKNGEFRCQTLARPPEFDS